MIEVYDKEKGIWKKKFSVEEIGNYFGGIFINIDKKFAKKYLFEKINPFHSYFDNYFKHPTNGVDTNIICPFCEKGTLIMVRKKKIICETHICHRGDEYDFRCSNFGDEKDGCKKGILHYSDVWLYC